MLSPVPPKDSKPSLLAKLCPLAISMPRCPLPETISTYPLLIVTVPVSITVPFTVITTGSSSVPPTIVIAERMVSASQTMSFSSLLWA